MGLPQAVMRHWPYAAEVDPGAGRRQGPRGPIVHLLLQAMQAIKASVMKDTTWNSVVMPRLVFDSPLRGSKEILDFVRLPGIAKAA